MAELSERTYIEPWVLSDMLHQMRGENLCEFTGEDETMVITSTPQGVSTVRHIFNQGEELEAKALKGIPSEKSRELLATLKTILENTRL